MGFGASRGGASFMEITRILIVPHGDEWKLSISVKGQPIHSPKYEGVYNSLETLVRMLPYDLERFRDDTEPDQEYYES